MATCFGPLPLSGKQFDANFPVGRPPCKGFSHRPPRVRTSRRQSQIKKLEDVSLRSNLSSTYKSFRDPYEDEISVEWNPTLQRNKRRSVSRKLNKENESNEEQLHMSHDHSIRIRKHRRDRVRSKTLDGYSSDTTLLPNKPKIFLSTFKSDDNEFESALLSALREKSRSSQNLMELKKSVMSPMSPRLKPVSVPTNLTIPKFDKNNLKRSVTFSAGSTDENPDAPKRSKYSVLKTELPSLTFEQMKNCPNTIHPRKLYSTRQYQDLHLTIFYGNECINPPPPPSSSPPSSETHIRRAEKVEAIKRFSYGSGSLRRQRSARPSSFGERLFRSHSEGNLNESSEKLENQSGTTNSSSSKYFQALNRSWRNLLNLGGMSRPSKVTPMAKKVAPPAVPDVFRHSGSSFGSAGYASSDDGFMPLPPPDAQSNISDRSDIYGVSGKSPGPGGQFNYQSFTFPGKGIYYHHQQSLQEDQGIDLTQSPGRDSPGSSGSGSGSGSGSRHSTASLDSGRASGSHLLGSRAPGSTLSSSPRCSISSSSIVSSEHGGPGARVERLIQQGIPDQDVIHAWLQDLHFEEYFTLFVSAGYDMPTISKMTPEDLTAIGIKKPNHRKKLKAEIAQLNISDGLPEYIPGSMEEWLTLLRLEEYIATFRQQGYQSVEDVTQLAWEDLEEAGVVKLGHQKRLLLAIKRVKDIRAGKIFSHLGSHTLVTQAELHTPSPGSIELSYHHSMSRSYHHPWDLDSTRQLLGYSSPYCPDIVPIKIRGGRGKSLESLEDGERTGTHHTFSPENTGTFYYNNININSGNNLQLQCGGWRRSYEDGDITPTNEAMVALHEGGGTLPRPRGLVRPRPVAKIPATRSTNSHYFDKPSYNIYDMKEFSPEPLKDTDLIQSDPSGDLQEKCTVPPSMPPISGIYDYKYRYSVAENNPGLMHGGPVILHNSPAMRRRPPSPPKRQSSHSSDLQTSIDCSSSKDNGMIQQTTVVELHTHSSVPLPNYSSPSPSSELSSQLETLHLSWRNEKPEEEDEQKLIAALAQQVRNGSDASFKSSSSTESDSLPFANENAGTIKQRTRCQSNEYAAEDARRTGEQEQEQEPSDVLSDIGNMLANLTDELDAMLEEEKRQGLNLE